MCGIAGAVNYKLSYQLINNSMLHRGPDEQNGFTEHNTDLYHLRLSIQDIGGGRQPMQLDNRYTIIFNGEIYNHQDLRKQFQLAGHTTSDTETLLLLYRKLGNKMLTHLDGMFVFAIYDNQLKELFIARDRAGKKPLYYYHDTEKIVFASELNCLKSLLPLQPAHQHIYHYLRLGALYRQYTPYQQVQELQGGHWLKINCQTLQQELQCWWSIHPFYLQQQQDDLATALQKTNHFLHQGIKRRIESSDLEVGCFLSGGIDSGLVTAIASQYNQQLKTFTVSFDGEYNEAPLAQLVADKYHTRHTSIHISFNSLQQDVEQILANYGEPFFDSSAIPSYYVSAEAKKHLTVILNGDGADELFGGYRRYVPFARYDFFKASGLIQATAALTKKLLPPANNKKSVHNYLYRLASLASKNSIEIYLSAGVDIFEDYQQHFNTTAAHYLQPMLTDFEAIANAPMSGLQKIMNIDFDCNLFSDLLVKMDIATMAHSLEGRSPFLCKELLEYIPGLPDEHKVKGRTTKYLLRQLAQQYLPAPLIHQPKRGFEIPLKTWVNTVLKEIIHDYCGSPNAYSRQFISPAFLQALLNNTQNIPAEKRAKMLWTLLSLEVWHKKAFN
ncbi:MAG: hypothetical protein RL172_843 [Bacteroidota bacterium]|jgi:asparagine synthase (glutamine-hydrolysing)